MVSWHLGSQLKGPTQGLVEWPLLAVHQLIRIRPRALPMTGRVTIGISDRMVTATAWVLAWLPISPGWLLV